MTTTRVIPLRLLLLSAFCWVACGCDARRVRNRAEPASAPTTSAPTPSDARTPVAPARVVTAPFASTPSDASAEEPGDSTDILVALDVSGSMRAVWYGAAASSDKASRLAVAKAAVADLVARHEHDAIGIVLFGREAYGVSPLTHDHPLLLRLLSKIEVGVVDEAGSAIGDALMRATHELGKGHAPAKLIVLIADGDNTAGTTSPDSAAQSAKAAGCRISALQIGDGSEADVPAGKTATGETVYRRERFPVNPALLTRTAEATGGRMTVVSSSDDFASTLRAVVP